MNLNLLDKKIYLKLFKRALMIDGKFNQILLILRFLKKLY